MRPLRFFRSAGPLPATPVDARTEDMTCDSSEDLSALLNEMEEAQIDIEVMPTQHNAVFLDEKVLSEQGKVHKTQILSSWVACQVYLSQAELEARARQSAFRMNLSSDDTSPISEMTSRSGLTSRTSSSTTNFSPSVVRSKQSQQNQRAPQLKKRFSSFSRRNKGDRFEVQTVGHRYDSYPGDGSMIHLIHDDSARVEEEWKKLNSVWRTSLHVAGPKGNNKRTKPKLA